MHFSQSSPMIQELKFYKGYRLFSWSSVTFLILCCTHMRCLSSSSSIKSSCCSSSFNTSSLLVISVVLHPGPAPLYNKNTTHKLTLNSTRGLYTNVLMGDEGGLQLIFHFKSGCCSSRGWGGGLQVISKH